MLKLPEAVRGFCRFGLQEFPSCRGLEEKIHHFDLSPLAAGRRHHAILADRPGVILCLPYGWSVRPATEAMEASASPRTRGFGHSQAQSDSGSCSSRGAFSASGSSSFGMPQPLSVTDMRLRTAALDPDLNPGRPASSAFSTSLSRLTRGAQPPACRNLADQLVRELGDRTPRCRLLFLLNFFHSHSADHVFSRFPYTRSNDGTRLSCYDREFPVLLSRQRLKSKFLYGLERHTSAIHQHGCHSWSIWPRITE